MMTDESRFSEFGWRNGRQYYAAIIGNLVMAGHGSIMGWISPAIAKLSSPDTPLDRPLTNEEISWIGSITSIGAMFGSLTFGFISSRLGCKRTMLFLSVPSTIFWILIYFGKTYYHILLARFITGWTGGGIQTTVVIYISEISSNEIRGSLGSIIQVTRNIGILLAYILGAVLNYEYIPCVFVCIPLLFVLCFTFIPNTVQYYLRCDDIQKAENSFKYYKGYKGKTEVEVNAFNTEFERMKSIALEQKTDEKLHFSDFTNSIAVKGMVIGIALAYFSQLTGCATIIVYAVYILERTGTTLDPFRSSIALAAVLILGNLCTTQLADAFGRKTVLIVSLCGCALGHIGLSLFLYLNQIGYNLSYVALMPVFCLGIIVFIASAGVIPLSHVCRVENLPTKIRTLGLAICVLVLNFSAFVSNKLFPVLIERIGLHGCMIIFAVNCIIGSFFMFFILNETRGKPMDTLHSETNHTVTR